MSAPVLFNAISSAMMLLQMSMHSLQIKTLGPAMSLWISLSDLPQNEQCSLALKVRVSVRFNHMTNLHLKGRASRGLSGPPLNL